MGTECLACGAQVSTQFRRVFAGDDGAVHACLSCTTNKEIYEGAVAGRSLDKRTRGGVEA